MSQAMTSRAILRDGNASDLVAAPPATRIPHAFDSTDALSLGAEEEFMLVDPASGALVAHAARVLEACAAFPDGGRLDPEIVQSVVEVASPVCADARALQVALDAQRAQVARAAHRAGCCVASGGTHPFDGREQPITEGARYAEIALEYPWIIQEAATYGLHVHVGVRGADRAIATCNALRSWLPHLLALSASSPWWRGERTGLASTRVQLAQLFPRSGMPPTFDDYADFERAIASLEASGTVPDYSYTWWFVRPHPRYGTVEVRICDAQSDARHSAALAALVQALVAWIGDQLDSGGRPRGTNTLVAEENLWSAARHGTRGSFVDEAGTAVPTRVALRSLLRDVTPWLAELGSIGYLPVLNGLAQRNEAERQLADFAEPSALLVRRLVDETIGRRR